MTEIKGLLLSKEEEKACLDLVKELRKRKTYTIDYSGHVQVKAKTLQEANDIFWDWIIGMQNKTCDDWSGIISKTPVFENEGVEEE